MIRRAFELLGANARRRGLAGGNPAWLAVFAGAKLIALLRRAAKRGEKPLRYSQALRPGETLEISHLPSKR